MEWWNSGIMGKTRKQNKKIDQKEFLLYQLFTQYSNIPLFHWPKKLKDRYAEILE
jgi:hypothetical protein